MLHGYVAGPLGCRSYSPPFSASSPAAAPPLPRARRCLVRCLLPLLLSILRCVGVGWCWLFGAFRVGLFFEDKERATGLACSFSSLLSFYQAAAGCFLSHWVFVLPVQWRYSQANSTPTIGALPGKHKTHTPKRYVTYLFQIAQGSW